MLHSPYAATNNVHPVWQFPHKARRIVKKKSGVSFGKRKAPSLCRACVLLPAFLVVIPLAVCPVRCQDDPYPFPPLLVCVWDGQGCDEALGQNVCINTTSFTVYDSCNEPVSSDEEPRGINIPSQVSAQQ